MSWKGVDLDGTLSLWERGSTVEKIGPPIPAMLERVKKWLADGEEVRIVTARVGNSGTRNGDGLLDGREFADAQRELIHAWCLEHLGRILRVTAEKDFHMEVLWDDRAVQVVTNTGLTKAEYDLPTSVVERDSWWIAAIAEESDFVRKRLVARVESYAARKR